MNRNPIARAAAIAAGAAVLFWLQQGYELPLYFAIPGGLVAYIATLLAMNFVLKTGPSIK